MVLRRIVGPKRDEVTGEWRKLHSEELHNLYSSPDIIRQVKSRRMRWEGHVACMGEERKVNRWESPREGDHLEDQGVGGKMVSEWIVGRLAWGCGLDSTGSGQGPVAGYCECSDEPSGSCATELVSYRQCTEAVHIYTARQHPYFPHQWADDSSAYIFLTENCGV
jgi:hypothetical protein